LATSQAKYTLFPGELPENTFNSVTYTPASALPATPILARKFSLRGEDEA